MPANVCVYLGEELASYNFGPTHPFGPQRHAAFENRFDQMQLRDKVEVLTPVQTDAKTIGLFHTNSYIDEVQQRSKTGQGYLDAGDTPAFVGVYEAASYVVGSAVGAAKRIMQGEYQRGFVPIAGLHHASRKQASGFCVFNDCGVVAEMLRAEFGLSTVAYVDIDAHHGDGVFYGFEDDPYLVFADVHEDGRYLFPGTGFANETGKGAAQGRKLNLPMEPGSKDEQFFEVWPQIEDLLLRTRPEFILLQCGVDSIDGDPITHMRFSESVHAHVAQALCVLADKLGHGRVLALGGGGYNLENIARGWNAVVEQLILNTN
jgi:acetoin utilization protein AcuC